MINKEVFEMLEGWGYRRDISNVTMRFAQFRAEQLNGDVWIKDGVDLAGNEKLVIVPDYMNGNFMTHSVLKEGNRSFLHYENLTWRIDIQRVTDPMELQGILRGVMVIGGYPLALARNNPNGLPSPLEYDVISLD